MGAGRLPDVRVCDEGHLGESTVPDSDTRQR